MKNFAVIVAATAGSLGIGKNGKLPWRLSGDMVNIDIQFENRYLIHASICCRQSSRK